MGKSKEIIKYDNNGNEVCRYESAKIAYETEGINRDKFMKNVNKNKFINGFNVVVNFYIYVYRL